MTTSPAPTASSIGASNAGGRASHGPGWFGRAEAWLDARGKGAWIATMVLAFIFFWPLGLAL